MLHVGSNAHPVNDRIRRINDEFALAFDDSRGMLVDLTTADSSAPAAILLEKLA